MHEKNQGCETGVTGVKVTSTGSSKIGETDSEQMSRVGWD